MERQEVLNILSIIPKTGDPNVDTSIENAKRCLRRDSVFSKHVKNHSDKEILMNHINMMHELFDLFVTWYDWVHGDSAYCNLPDNQKLRHFQDYYTMVNQLFLSNTEHSGKSSTLDKCLELGLDPDTGVTFKAVDLE